MKTTMETWYKVIYVVGDMSIGGGNYKSLDSAKKGAQEIADNINKRSMTIIRDGKSYRVSSADIKECKVFIKKYIAEVEKIAFYESSPNEELKALYERKGKTSVDM